MCSTASLEDKLLAIKNVGRQTAFHVYTVPLKGNVALALHSTARSSRIKRSILALNAHSASERRVVNHSRLVRVLSIVSRSSLGLMPTASSGE